MVWKILGGGIISITVNVSGTLKTLTEISANVSGTLKSLSTIQTNVNGTLKQIFSAKPADITGSCSGSVSGATIATNIVISTSCTVSGSMTLSSKGNSGPVNMRAIDSSKNVTYIINTSQSSSTGLTYTGSTTLPAGTYSFGIAAYNYSSTGVGSSPNVTYSITFS